MTVYGAVVLEPYVFLQVRYSLASNEKLTQNKQEG